MGIFVIALTKSIALDNPNDIQVNNIATFYLVSAVLPNARNIRAGIRVYQSFLVESLDFAPARGLIHVDLLIALLDEQIEMRALVTHWLKHAVINRCAGWYLTKIYCW